LNEAEQNGSSKRWRSSTARKKKYDAALPILDELAQSASAKVYELQYNLACCLARS